MRLRKPVELTVFLNGKFVRASQARISIFDHSFLFGDGICEEMRAYNSGIFSYLEHFQRILLNSRSLNMPLPMGCRAVYKTIKILLKQNYLEDAHIRIILSRGEGVPFMDPDLSPESSFCIIVSENPPFPDKAFQNGVTAVTLENGVFDRKPQQRHLNHTSMIDRVVGLRHLKDKADAFEGIYVNSEGFITEGIRSSVFLVKDGKLLAPDIDCGLCDWVARKNILKLARTLDIEVVETFLNLEDLYEADECFVTRTIWGIVPIVDVDSHSIGGGRIGQLTKYLQREYQRFIISDILNSEKMLD